MYSCSKMDCMRYIYLRDRSQRDGECTGRSRGPILAPCHWIFMLTSDSRTLTDRNAVEMEKNFESTTYLPMPEIE